LTSSAINIRFSLNRVAAPEEGECHHQAKQGENRALNRTQATLTFRLLSADA
jgi:hypothetical protein